MAVTATCSNRYKYALAKKLLDLSTDTIRVLLMRSGFTFLKDDHATLINIKGDTTATTLNAVNPTSKFTRTSGSFIADGFVVGNSITASGFGSGDDLTYTILTVSALEIVVNETVPADVTGGGDERLIADDELAGVYGYVKDTKTTGTITLTEDDTYDYLNASFPNVTWTASGGSIGPTPGAILYDFTATEKTIIGYIDFDGEQTATTGETFNIAAGTIRIA